MPQTNKTIFWNGLTLGQKNLLDAHNQAIWGGVHAYNTYRSVHGSNWAPIPEWGIWIDYKKGVEAIITGNHENWFQTSWPWTGSEASSDWVPHTTTDTTMNEYLQEYSWAMSMQQYTIATRLVRSAMNYESFSHFLGMECINCIFLNEIHWQKDVINALWAISEGWDAWRNWLDQMAECNTGENKRHIS